jgi:catechol O-methyltransferase
MGVKQSLWRAAWGMPGFAKRGQTDNVRVPGAPRYRAYMRDQQGKLFDTVEHKTHLESEYLGG